MSEKIESTSIDQIVHHLRGAADGVQFAQAELDMARAAYEDCLTHLSIQALNAPIFPVKGDETALRPALNDRERELAVEQTCQRNERFQELRKQYELCQRVARFAKDHQDNWRKIADLVISQSK